MQTSYSKYLLSHEIHGLDYVLVCLHDTRTLGLHVRSDLGRECPIRQFSDMQLQFEIADIVTI